MRTESLDMRRGIRPVIAVALLALAGCADAAAGDAPVAGQPAWAASSAAECEAAVPAVTDGFTTVIDRAATDPESFNNGAYELGQIIGKQILTLSDACPDDAAYAEALSAVAVGASEHTPPDTLFASVAQNTGVGTVCQVVKSVMERRNPALELTPQAQLVCTGR